MRYTLTDSANGNVQLIKELAYIESYIELFRMRFAPFSYVDFKVDGVTKQDEITPLILIPFVENAFKHGVINEPKQPVRINLNVQGNRLIFEVSNKINYAQKDYSSGIGLVNIHRRLDLIYPEKHTLALNEDDYYFTVSLKIEGND